MPLFRPNETGRPSKSRGSQKTWLDERPLKNEYAAKVSRIIPPWTEGYDGSFGIVPGSTIIGPGFFSD